MGMDLRYTVEEYDKLSRGLIGSLVCFDNSTPLYGEEKLGLGVILSHRRMRGEFHVRVAWIHSPYFDFQEVRQIGWLLYDRLFIVSKAKGDAKNDDQVENFKGIERKK